MKVEIKVVVITKHNKEEMVIRKNGLTGAAENLKKLMKKICTLIKF